MTLFNLKRYINIDKYESIKVSKKNKKKQLDVYKRQRCGNGEFIDLVKWDEEEYLKRTDNKAVKKTLSIPSWLNHKAEEKQLNFSRILQRALKEELELV